MHLKSNLIQSISLSSEIHVPPHSNYTESVFLVSDDAVLVNTNHSCQLSEVPQDLTQGVVGLPLPQNVSDSGTYYVMKARKTRVTHKGRKALMSAHKTECKDQAITKTEDFIISEESYKAMQGGGVVTVPKAINTRACRQFGECIYQDPRSCGFTFVNSWADQPVNITLRHQVF